MSDGSLFVYESREGGEEIVFGLTMVTIRNEQRIKRLKLVSQLVSFLGMGTLFVGLALLFVGDDPIIFVYQFAALFVGYIFSQIGIALAHLYVRTPRPDEMLDGALKGFAKGKNGRLYHYILPVRHVLLLPTGILILNAKYQTGKISVAGDKWQQKGLGLRRFFGQEKLGNPTKEIEKSVAALANFINKHAPEVEEIPIAALIIFTSKGLEEYDFKKSRIPAMPYTKVKKHLKQKYRATPMPEADYQAIRAAFDALAVQKGALELDAGSVEKVVD